VNLKFEDQSDRSSKCGVVTGQALVCHASTFTVHPGERVHLCHSQAISPSRRSHPFRDPHAILYLWSRTGLCRLFTWENAVSARTSNYIRPQRFSIRFSRVVAQVEAKMVKPPPERPFEGLLTIHSEISPMASSEYEPGRCVHGAVCLTCASLLTIALAVHCQAFRGRSDHHEDAR
jgi:hypothetical protein